MAEVDELAVPPVAAPIPAAARSADDDIRDLASGAFVVFLGKMAHASRGAFIWAITLLCGLEVQGLYSMAWAVCSSLSRVARFGLWRSVVYFVTAARARPDGESPPAAADDLVNAAIAAGYLLALAASAAVVAGVYLTADAIAAFYDKPIAGALRIMAWTAPCIALSFVLTAATRALRIMRYEVLVLSVGGPLILFVGGATVGLAGLGLEAVSWVQLASSVGGLAMAAFFFSRHFSLAASLRAAGRPTPWRQVARFSLPVTVTDLLYALLTQLDVLMLGGFVSVKLVGIYVLARRVASAVLKAPQAFDAIFSSVVSDLSLQQRHGELGHRFVVVSRWILTVNLPILAGLLLVGDSILSAVGGAQLASVADLEVGLQILVVLCLGMMVQSVLAVAEPLLAMSGRPGVNLVNNGLWLALNFGLNLWLIDDYGVVGAAVGAAVAMVLANLLRVAQVYLWRGLLPFGRSQLKPLAAAALAAVPAWWLRSGAEGLLWRAAVPVTAYAAAYVGLLLLLRPEPEDRMVLRRLRGWVAARLRIRAG